MSLERAYLLPGKIMVAAGGLEIITILGSCVAVALADTERGIAGLCHYLLPDSRIAGGGVPDTGRYGDLALPELLHQLQAAGARTSALRARIYGGAEVLGNVSIGKDIGVANVAVARKFLSEQGIALKEERVGGRRGMRIALKTRSFEVGFGFVSGAEGEGEAQPSAAPPIGRAATPTAATALLPLPVPAPATDGELALHPGGPESVALVDAMEHSRKQFARLLARYRVPICSISGTTAECLQQLSWRRPGVLLVGLQGEGIRDPRNQLELGALLAGSGGAAVMVYSLGGDGREAIDALGRGAVDFVHTPEAFKPAAIRGIGELLVEKVRALLAGPGPGARRVA